jgi:4-hydroxy-tetrahydrodipicolinate synthase
LVTPLVDRDSLDVAGLERLVERAIAGGVAGLFVLGTTGEAPSLSYRLRREMIGRTCALARERVPVLAGITDTAFAESVALACAAAEAGASAVVLSTPYYFPAGQTELADYIDHLVPELPLPLLLYNMPALTKVWFETETLRRLAGHGAVIGVKDSSGDMGYFARLLELRAVRPDWTFFMGPEHLLVEAVLLGADGGVNGGANIFPGLFVAAYHAAATGDATATAACQGQIAALQEIYTIGKYASSSIKATKCALSLLGVCDDFMAEPFHRFKAPEREKVAAVLGRLDPILAK